MKRPEEVLKEEYRRWVEDNSPGLSSEAVDTVVESWEPESIAIKAMKRFAAQFVGDWEEIMNDNYPDGTRPTINHIHLLNGLYNIEQVMDENNIHPDDIINVIRLEDDSYELIYHALKIPNHNQKRETNDTT